MVILYVVSEFQSKYFRYKRFLSNPTKKKEQEAKIKNPCAITKCPNTWITYIYHLRTEKVSKFIEQEVRIFWNDSET